MSESHVKECMRERRIDARLVQVVLRQGRPVGGTELDEYGDWRIQMRRKVAGRWMHVIVAVCADHVECITCW